MQFKKYITLLASALLLFACAKEEFDTPTSTPDGPVTVGFWVGRGDTRTETPNAGFEMDAPLGAEPTRTHASSFGNNKLSVSWSNGDQVAMWAKPAAATEEATFTFSNQTFKNWFVSADSQNAYFTTTLDNAMPAKNENDEDITYNYYVCYPTPASANGTITTFTIPSTQDGKMGGGADIMMAQGSGIALQSLDSDGDFVVDKPEDYPSFTMKHLIHSLMFYVPAGEHWGFPDDETIERIVFTMPSTATGIVTADVKAAAPALALQTAGSNTIALNLTDPIGPSSGNDLDFAAASIIPSTYNGDLTVKVYSQTKASQVTFSDIDRNMAANHVTPVILNCSNTVDQYVLRFKLGENNLGEGVNTIVFKNSSGTEIYRIENVEENLKKPGFHDIDFTFAEDKTAFTSLAGQTITAEYDSAHALVKNTFTMPAVNTPGRHEVELTVPYLFFEDFSLLNGYDIDGGNVSAKQQGAKTINDSFHYSGWTGEQTSGKAGDAIRIRTRNETTWAFYNGRVDSAPISGLKDGASVKVLVSFDYNAVAEESGDECMSFSYGYTTTQGPIDAYWWYRPLFGSRTGGSHIENAITISLPSSSNMASFDNNVYPSSYYTIDDFTISSCTNKHRLSWEPLASGTNNHLANSKNHWLYLDNIKVKIIP